MQITVSRWCRKMNRGYFLQLILVFVIYCIASRPCESLDVTTIYRNNRDFQSNYTTVECHARTNALGLPFLTANGSTFEPEVGLTIPSCQIGLKPNCPWTARGWEITGGWDLKLPPLKLHPDVVKADMYIVDVVHNMLHLEHQASSVLKCDRARQYANDIDLGNGIGKRKCHSIGNTYIRWMSMEYVMFKMDMTGGRIELWRNGSSMALFSQVEINPLRVKYVAVATTEIELDWILYLDGRVWSLIGVTGTLKSPILSLSHSRSKDVCVSFFTFMDPVPGSGIKVSARFRNGSYEHMGHIYSNEWEKKWILQRVKFSPIEYDENLTIQVVVEGLKGNRFATVSVHGLMGCNANGTNSATFVANTFLDQTYMKHSPSTQPPIYIEVSERPEKLPDDQEIAVIAVSFDRDNPFICNVPTVYDEGVVWSPCRTCLHGGECEPISGRCSCPAGFIGDICEEGTPCCCGPNAFGRDCLGLCSGHKDGCKGLILCVPSLGCNCAPGYMGTDCNIPCQPGRYGPRCAFVCGLCSCESHCDTYTGVCTEGCSPGYYLPLCDITYSYLLQPPTITKIGATKVTFTFLTSPENIAGAGEPSFYQIQSKENNGEQRWATKTTMLIRRQSNHPTTESIDTLNPGTEYMIRIILLDRDGSFYANDSVVPFVTVITTCEVPKTPLYDIEARWKTRSEFDIFWKYDPNDRTACRLVHYRVYLSEGWRRYLYNTTTENTITVPNRSPVFKYSVQIQAMTAYGASVMSDAVAVKTMEGAPSRVIRLLTKQISPTEIEVQWTGPRFVPGDIKSYIIEYKCLRYLACPQSVECTDYPARFETKQLFVRLTGLHPHAQYDVKVAAFTIELGPWVKTKATTSFATPEVAPKAAEFAIISRSADAIEVTWDPVGDCRLLHGFPLYYHYWLYIEERDRNGNMTLVADGNVTHPPINFTSLRSYTVYMIHVVQVVTGGLYDTDYKLEIPAKTRGTVAPAVRDLSAVGVTSSSISLKWSFPLGVPRHAIKHFFIIFTCVKLLACDESVGNCTSNGTMKRNQTWATIPDLQSYADYDVKIAAYTGEIGNYSMLRVSTLTKLPEVAPTLDPSESPKSGSEWISLRWKRPADCTRMNGPLQGYWYRIFQDEDDTFPDSSTIMPTFTTDTWANVTMLPSFRLFRIEIAIVNNMSYSPSWEQFTTLNITVRTRPAVPKAVTELTAYKRGEEVVGLRWRMGQYLHGPIDSVEIRTTNNVSTSVQRVATVACLVWKSFVCHDIRYLQPNSTYTFVIRPYSSAVGELGLPASITSQTIEGVPEPPSFVRLARKTDKSLIVEWGHPNMPNGILRSFHIITEHVDSYRSEMCCDTSMEADVQVFRENATYAAQIKGLKPASQYLITVNAVTFARSSPVTLAVHTKPGVPQLKDNPPYIVQETITNTTAEIVLNPAVGFNGGPIWTYFVMVCSLDSNLHPDVNPDPILIEVKEEVQKSGFIALVLSEKELDDVLIVTIGNGEESLGMYGFIRNQPLHPNTSYVAVQIVMTEYMGTRSYGMAETDSFTTLQSNN